MPHWTIRTRDDNGKDEKIKVRANDAGEAIRVAEVDINHVLVVKTDWGTWGGRGEGTAKWAPKNSKARWLATLAVFAYFWAISMDATGSMFGRPGTVSTIGVYALLMGLVIGGTVLYTQNKARNEKLKAGVAQVLERKELKVQWWQGSLIKWGLLLVGVVMGVLTVMNLQEDAFKVPFEIFVPLGILWLVMYDPTDFV